MICGGQQGGTFLYLCLWGIEANRSGGTGSTPSQSATGAGERSGHGPDLSKGLATGFCLLLRSPASGKTTVVVNTPYSRGGASSGKLLVERGVDGFAKRRRTALDGLREPLYYLVFPLWIGLAYSGLIV